MISAECFSILYCCCSRTEVLTGYWIMLGIKDEHVADLPLPSPLLIPDLNPDLCNIFLF